MMLQNNNLAHGAASDTATQVQSKICLTVKSPRNRWTAKVELLKPKIGHIWDTRHLPLVLCSTRGNLAANFPGTAPSLTGGHFLISFALFFGFRCVP